jgi:hypothetical protein
MSTAMLVHPTADPIIEDKADARARFTRPVRTIDAEWKLGEYEGHEVYLVLSCGHSTRGKAFYAIVHVKRVRNGVWSAPFSRRVLGTEHIDHYSAKALRSFAAAMIVEVKAGFALATPTCPSTSPGRRPLRGDDAPMIDFNGVMLDGAGVLGALKARAEQIAGELDRVRIDCDLPYLADALSLSAGELHEHAVAALHNSADAANDIPHLLSAFDALIRVVALVESSNMPDEGFPTNAQGRPLLRLLRPAS